MQEFLDWLVTAAAGPAFFGLPVTWAASDLAGAAKRWLERLRRTDGLSRLVMAAAEGAAPLCDAEFRAVRDLLEKEETWEVAGRGTVDELAVLISADLPGRPVAVGQAIAAGVLEFAVHDLEPKLFKAALLARLDRLEANQASRLDRELFAVHADLAVRLAVYHAAGDDRFSDLAGRLSRVLDRLPAGPAGPGEVAVYLARLAQWLDADPWPQDVRFGGPVLVPSQIERKLQITSARGTEERDADELSGQCSRLVVLGDPGTGKTWLARRAARRCALAALTALADGASLDQIELPLFTTCARFVAMPAGDGVRDAVVRSALGQLPDLGGARVTSAVQALFAERNAPTLVVLDSLDEASGPDDRIRLADTLPPDWRVILTSRPSSWNQQFAIETGETAQPDPSRQVGTLQPLEYPDDVDALITRWFAAKPEWGADLAAQLRDRPQLQEAAAVPLILTFYCILGGQQPLPASSIDLHAKVIKRMLTGRWRGSGDRPPDHNACLETLRSWAWLAAASDPVSGVGTWVDEFAAEPVRALYDREALDHVAIPQGPPDPDTGMIARRFVHRSIHEYLVAWYVALLPADEAAEVLIGHLWYDPDWQEYAVHIALALHPRRDKVLRALVRRVTGSDVFPGEIRALDWSFQVRAFLAFQTDWTTEADWSPEAAALIVQARIDLAEADMYLPPASGWPASQDLPVNVLLGKLEAESSGVPIRALVDVLTKRNLSEADNARMRAAVLRALERTSWSVDTTILAALIARLAPSAAERATARHNVIHTIGRTFADLDAEWNAGSLADLTETSEEQAEVIAELIKSAAHRNRSSTAIADVIDRLGPTAEQRRSARATLLRRLDEENTVETAADLSAALARLRPTSRERAAALDTLLQHVISAQDPHPGQAGVSTAITELAATHQDRRCVHEILIKAITRETAAGDTSKVCCLTRLIAGLELTAGERARVTHALLRAIAAETSQESVHALAQAGLGLDPDPGERELFRVRGLEAALAHCTSRTPGQLCSLSLFESLPELAVTADERVRALNAALNVLANVDHVLWSAGKVLSSLAGTTQAQDRVRAALLARLAATADSHSIMTIAELLRPLVHRQKDRDRVRTAFLGKLGLVTSQYELGPVAGLIGELSDTESGKAEARRLLLKTLHENGVGDSTEWRLSREIADLRPVVTDLDGLGDPPYGLGREVLAAMRANSPLDAWLAALPNLTRPRKATGAGGRLPSGLPSTTKPSA